jgi:cytochrome c
MLRLLTLLLIVWGGWVLAILSPNSGQTPETPPAVSPTPTIDRLAAPPTAENPNQADEGAQLFWLHCQPCHGDRGQGLTEEWRAQYPPEDQNCWNSGCHGNRPYENGFTLPTAVPPVTGEESLARFETMGQVYGFISAAMPYQDPGYLTEEEYLAMTAFLAREHGLWDGTPLNPDNVNTYYLRRSAATATPQPTPTGPVSETTEPEETANILLVIIIGTVVFLLIVVVLARQLITKQ